MSQAAIGTIDPASTSGAQLAALLIARDAAILSGNLGASRPSYAVKGTVWLRETSALIHDLMVFDGVGDRLLAQLDLQAGTLTPASHSHALATTGADGFVRKATSAQGAAGASDVVWPTVLRVKAMIDAFAAAAVPAATTAAAGKIRLATAAEITDKSGAAAPIVDQVAQMIATELAGFGGVGFDFGATADDVQTFDSSGTWTKPGQATDSSLVRVYCLGGGGGGGGSNGSGGVGGAGVRLILSASALGATETVTVGAAGAGNGGKGGDSNFGDHVFAGGGVGGAPSSSVVNGAGSGGVYEGGFGGLSSTTASGRDGGISLFGGRGGQGARELFSAGSGRLTSPYFAGDRGGGGGGGTANGQSGAAGRVIVETFY